MSEDRKQSTFVTVVAWIFIALSGFGTAISILQNIMVQTVFRSPEVSQAMQAPPPGAPPFAAFMATHFQWFFLAFLLISAFMLASSIGMLRRRNWARLSFIGLLSLAILWQVGGLALQFSMFSSMREQFSAAGQGGPDMGPFFIAMAVVSVLFAVGFSVLFGWIIKRLLSPAVVAEFIR
ncbi:hypothetical protein LJB71_11415 [Thermomonas sp. S9]|uniref:hypothetical protein n=1 Tax=Thermomonas sp. S9 TaxID=2885203 RepID=UPI00216AB3EE|nr:hypothetical protein [Thermomonas sp. S9]MCR6496750.1 hypothetical protein [Thermomonas sp. S9]MCR6496756.1 hypothetical protein [Thermomonas sp. S9]